MKLVSHARRATPPPVDRQTPGRRRLLAVGLASSLLVPWLAFASPAALDPAFDRSRGADGQVHALALGADGRWLVGGGFNFIHGELRPCLARLLPDGTLDPAFTSPFPAFATGPITSIHVLPDQSLLVAGQLSSIGEQPMQAVARLFPDGRPDPGFKATGALPYFPTCVAADAQGRVYLGAFEGGFSGLVRLLPEGTLDVDFQPAYAAGVYDVAPLPDGGVLVGGMGGVARLSANGALAPGPQQSLDGPVYTLRRLDDGRFFAGGPFTQADGQPRPGLARWRSDGQLDPAFVPTAAPNGAIERLLPWPDGSVIVSGDFTEVGGQLRLRLARYLPDGVLDPEFDPGRGPDSHVRALLRLPDGATAAGGAFSAWEGQPGSPLVRLVGPNAKAPGWVEFASASVSGNEGADTVAITLRRFSGAGGVVAVGLETVPVEGPDGATPDADFLLTNQIVSFAEGVTERVLEIRIFDDVNLEAAERLGLRLVEPTGGLVIGVLSNATVILVDNDFGVRFANSDVNVSELLPEARVLVQRVGATGSPFSIGLESISDTALAGRDFLPLQQRLEFGAADTEIWVSVPLVDNPDPNDPRAFRLRLLEPIGAPPPLDPAEVTVRLRDNERPGGLVTDYTRSVNSLRLSDAVIFPDGSVVGLSNVMILTSGNPVRFDAEGRRDPTFQPALNRVRGRLAVTPDGDWLAISTLVIGNGSPLLRLLPDGRLHPDWPTNLMVPPNQDPAFLTALPDGNVYLSVSQVTQGDRRADGFVRISPEGELDTAFDVSVNTGSRILAVAREPSGRLIIGGTFTSVEGRTRRGLARIETDGSLDRTFMNQPNPGVTSSGGQVLTIVALPEGGCLIGGTFLRFDNQSTPLLARLLADGSVDASFELPGTGLSASSGPASVQGLRLDSRGRVLVFGRFDRLDGQALKAPLLRLTPQGTVDPDFDPGIVGSAMLPRADALREVVLAPDGSATLFGSFTHVDGVSANSLARIYLDAPGAPPLTLSRLRMSEDRIPHLEFTLGRPERLIMENARPSDAVWTWSARATNDWPAGPVIWADPNLWADPNPDANSGLYRLRRGAP